MRVLLVEDRPDMAACVTLAMHQLGHDLWHEATVQGALQALETRQHFDAAMLDIRVGTDLVYPVAEKLRVLRIPFFFATAVAADGLPPGYEDIWVLPKPYILSQLESVLASCRG